MSLIGHNLRRRNEAAGTKGKPVEEKTETKVAPVVEAAPVAEAAPEKKAAKKKSKKKGK